MWKTLGFAITLTTAACSSLAAVSWSPAPGVNPAGQEPAAPEAALTEVPPVIVPGVGWEGQGAGVVVTNLNSHPSPEIILMAYDNPPGQNSFRLKIGWDIDIFGNTAKWSDDIEIPGVGWEAQGAGMAITNLDTFAWPELILMAYDNPSGDNTFRYRIAWNVNPNGVIPRWSDIIDAPGVGFPSEGQGAGVVVSQLDSNTRPDIILLAYVQRPFLEPPRLMYRIGYNLDVNGIAERWSEPIRIFRSGLGGQAEEAGVTIVNDPPPAVKGQIAVMLRQKLPPLDSYKYFFSPLLPTVSVGAAPLTDAGVHGADFAVLNLGSDPRPDLLLMTYYNGPQMNWFSYQFASNITESALELELEMDKLSNVAWPPTILVSRPSGGHTLVGLFAKAGIRVTQVKDEGEIPDLHPGMPYTDAELDSFRQAHDNLPQDPSNPQRMRVHAGFLTRHVDDTLRGIMFDHPTRGAFVVFAGQFRSEALYLRVTCHELGHALNLLHSDGDGWDKGPVDDLGRSIMNRTGTLADDWDFAWSATELHHFYHHPIERWFAGGFPTTTTAFGNCH